MIAKDVKQKHIELIRQVLAIQPRATIEETQKTLEKNGVVVNYHYVARLIQKIKTERVVRYDIAKVTARISEMQDKFDEIQKQLWKILLDNSKYEEGRYKGRVKVRVSEKIAAAVALIKADKELLDAQMDAGVFERKLGTLEADLSVKIDDPEKLQILKALRNYGVINDTGIVDAEFKTTEIKQIETKNV